MSIASAIIGPEIEAAPTVLHSTPVPLITRHPDGTSTESVIRVVHPPEHPPSGEPIVHDCAGLTGRTR